MRKIKFRIWNGESIEETIIDFNIDKETKYKEFYIYPDDVFMQFTGLKDKNGVEIYEGDIVKWGHIEKFEESWHRVALVELSPSLQFHILNYIDSNTLEYKKGDNYIFGYSNFIYKKTHEAMEVIGNIYENPELLRED